MSSFVRQTLLLRPGEPVILNLGLCTRRSPPSDAVAARLIGAYTVGLRDVLSGPAHREVILSDDAEPTLVVVGRFNDVVHQSDALWALLRNCDQDCCAILYTGTGDGVLYGEKAEDWGPFDPSLFLKPRSYDD